MAKEKEILMAGYAGLRESLVLLKKNKEKLLERYPGFYLEEFLEKEEGVGRLENLPALCTNIYPLGKGGVFAGLWMLATGEKAGIEVELKKIPIFQETIEICNFFDVNPYQADTEGFLFLSEQTEADCRKLWEVGIFAEKIGQTRENNDKIVRNGEEIRYLEKVRQERKA